MRIQETDRILKDARVARHSGHAGQNDRGGATVISRAWRAILGAFKR
jgi:hypothetical protein